MYILYLGLNDKNTKKQEISTADARKIVSEYCAKVLGFATISEASGVYTHENGDVVEETTLQVKVSGVNEEEIRTAANWLKDRFNQESIGLLTIPFEIDLI